MIIQLHRIYEDGGGEGYRVLVDRLWPRGISKDEARLDDHWKDLAPSDDLRKWFNHDPVKWGAFRKKYLHELSKNKDAAKQLLKSASNKNLILLSGARDQNHTHARVLKEYLEKLT